MIDQSLFDRVERQAWFYRYPRGWPFLLFLLASITTAVSVMAIEHADRQTRAVELDRNLTEISSALQRRVTENIAVLRAASALFATQDSVSEEQFREFAADLQHEGNLYGSLGMGWAPLVRADRLAYLELEIVNQGRSSFFVTPRPDFGDPYAVPIVYLEPGGAQNRRALGYNMYAEPTRRAAMDQAMKTGKPVASGKLRLIQDVGRPNVAGFLIYMPVVVIKGQSRIVKGFVYAPFRADDFIRSAGELFRADRLEVKIYDETVASENLLAQRPVDGLIGRTAERRIDVGNHSWVVQVSDKKTGMLSAISRITLFFGAVASLMVMAIGRLITRRAAEDRLMLERLSREASIRNSLTRELNHRVKNTLANVLSIAALTRRGSRDIDDFTDRLTSRIRALSATHDLLSQTDWTNAALRDVVVSELAPYMEGHEEFVTIDGPEIKLAPNDAMSLGLALHEMATNAAKYGALSVEDGRVSVTWQRTGADLASIHWRESGGPTVTEPSKRGFGRDLIEKIVAHELRGKVELQFLPGGVECRLNVPVRVLREFALRGGGQ
ncbi:CHASE domain-containing protein [Novosphingobium colocasiae]|uniref:histidine kinase n=1 Tax=Novosphingobium colocasiae TaxID=1256513 RepID=A0A918PBE8_9SPHN|nr:CHASE domain-containing protein [Novosphingobium colocasiae]GGY94206.1 histidine kinase [Novosphingobium colocasiae]